MQSFPKWHVRFFPIPCETMWWHISTSWSWVSRCVLGHWLNTLVIIPVLIINVAALLKLHFSHFMWRVSNVMECKAWTNVPLSLLFVCDIPQHANFHTISESWTQLDGKNNFCGFFYGFGPGF